MKIIFKIIFFLILILVILITYLSIFGIETTKFNQKIQSKIREINSNLIVELKDVKLTLNPLELNLSIKTIGPKVISESKSLDIQNIETNISLKSLLNNEFLIEQVEISTKSIELDNLISFTKDGPMYPRLPVINIFIVYI